MTKTQTTREVNKITLFIFKIVKKLYIKEIQHVLKISRLFIDIPDISDKEIEQSILSKDGGKLKQIIKSYH